MQKIPIQLMPFVRMNQSELVCYDNIPKNLIPLFEETKKKLNTTIEEQKETAEK